MRPRKINNQIINGSIKSALWKLAMPIMAGAALHDLFTLVDLFFIGRLGHTAVAALSISGFLVTVILMAVIGISTGATALIAHYTGKKDYASADSVLFQVVILSIICSLVMVLVGLFGVEGLLRLFGAGADIIPAAAEYLKITFVGSIFIFLFIAFNQALRGTGDVIVPLKILALANIINIILDPLLIFGLGPFPAMGVAGSALASVLSRAIGVVLLLKYFIFGYSGLHFHRRILRINPAIISRMVKIGFFASLEVLLRQLSLLLLLGLITSFGTATLAAYGIAIRLRMAMMMFGFGMGSAAAVLIGQNMGAGNAKRATQAGWGALGYYQAMIILPAVLFFIFAPQIIGVFNRHPEVVQTGSTLLRLIALTFPFLATALVLNRGISGAGDTLAPAVMTGVAQLALRIPIAFILALCFGLGPIGIWLGINSSDIAQGSAMLWYFKRGLWQKRYYQHRAILDDSQLVGV